MLTTLLANDKIHPRLAFEHCGLFVDPDLAYTQSMEYADKRKEEAQKELEMFVQSETQKSRENAEEDDRSNGEPTSEDDEQ